MTERNASLTNRFKQTMSDFVNFSITNRIFGGPGRITVKSNKAERTGAKKDLGDSKWSCEFHDGESDVNSSNKSENEGEDKDTFDVSKLNMPVTLTDKYEIGDLIGKGIYAYVLEVKNKETKEKCALKFYFSKHLKSIGEGRLSPCMKLTEDEASKVMYDLASALEYIHAKRIVHRDVKPEHMLIGENDDGTKSVKLGYFAFATEVTGPLYCWCGTQTYTAPEVIAKSGYGVKVDVWAAGVSAYELLSGLRPFSSPTRNQKELFDLIKGGKFKLASPLWDDVTVSAKSLILSMLQVDPDNRLSASQVLQHPWVSRQKPKAIGDASGPFGEKE